MSTLAVVIPAFKANYLETTLKHLHLQSNKRFKVYIGNDAGDLEIDQIVNLFSHRLDITYKYFTGNLGKISLVKHLERCLTMINNEDWIWILPDDDFADPGCVASFYQHLKVNDFDLFRFNVRFTNAEGTIFKENPPLPIRQSSFESLLEKLSFYRPSTIAEFIFRKSKFDSVGFDDIPLAWGSDDLLWFLIGWDKGIVSSEKDYVYLRQSSMNISNNYTTLARQKIHANFLFLQALVKKTTFHTAIQDINEREKFNRIAINHIMQNLQDFKLKLSLKEIYRYGIMANQIWGDAVWKNMRRFYLNNKRIN